MRTRPPVATPPLLWRRQRTVSLGGDFHRRETPLNIVDPTGTDLGVRLAAELTSRSVPATCVRSAAELTADAHGVVLLHGLTPAGADPLDAFQAARAVAQRHTDSAC